MVFTVVWTVVLAADVGACVEFVVVWFVVCVVFAVVWTVVFNRLVGAWVEFVVV